MNPAPDSPQLAQWKPRVDGLGKGRSLITCGALEAARCVVLGFILAAFPALAMAATVTVQTAPLGNTPELLAYNSGHFVPGSNTRDWWRYSGVSGARVFLTPSLIEPSDDIPGRGDGVTDQAGFLSRRAALRADPLNTNYINWPYLTDRYQLTREHGSNTLEPYYTCASLRRLGIEILVNITAGQGTFPIADANDWAGKWELWQHFYAQAFYLGREFGAQRYQMFNEPNHSSAGGLTQADFIQRLQLVSDAVQCALTEVNQLYDRSLVPRLVAPVTAGSATSPYASWGRPVVTHRHTNFLGQHDPNFWLVHQYDYHEYNSTPVTFGANLASLHSLLAADMAPEPRLPTSISEFNVHTAATFNTLSETLDSPSKYARFGAIVANLANNACNELYCFKFSQTLYSSTVPFKKNGMHFVDNTNAPFNIGGVTKAGEVYRLFNKAAAPGRQRLNVIKEPAAASLNLVATFDPATRAYHLFSANNIADADLTLDVGAWNLPGGQRVLLEEVSENRSGGVRQLLTVTNHEIAAGLQPSNTVWLFSLPTQSQELPQTLPATDDTMVQDGDNRFSNHGAGAVCWVRNNSTNAAGRSVSFIKFRLPVIYLPDIQFALLTVRAASINGGQTVQAHVYGLTNNAWSEHTLTWSTAPTLAQNVAPGTDYPNNFLFGAGDGAHIAGQFVADATPADRTIDVTEFVRGRTDYDVSFLLAREVRFYGDAEDDDGLRFASKEGDPDHGPRLLIVRLKDSDGDGLSDEAEINIFRTNPHNTDTDGDGVNDGEEVLVAGTDPGTWITPPAVSLHPASQSASVGDTVAFGVAATGTPPLAFQWQFNGTNALAGATTTRLTLAIAALTNTGEYSVTVSNAGGATTSSPAMLVVTNPAPLVTTLPRHEPFAYEAGSALVDQGGWLLNAGTTAILEAGNLSGASLAAATGNRLTWGNPSMSVRLPLETNLTSGEVWFSFLMRVDQMGASFTGAGTLAGFTTGSGTLFGTKINIRPNGAGGFNLGTSKAGGTTYGDWAPADFAPGETVFVVARYRFNSGGSTDDLCDLWLNPAGDSFSATVPPPATIAAVGNGGADLSQIDRFFFRSGGSSTSPVKLVVDELRLGFTWASVTPTDPPPLLQIQRDGDAAMLFWPAQPADWVLEETPTLLPPAWVTSTNPALAIGTNLAVTITPTNASRYYRLRK